MNFETKSTLHCDDAYIRHRLSTIQAPCIILIRSTSKNLAQIVTQATDPVQRPRERTLVRTLLQVTVGGEYLQSRSRVSKL